MFRHGYVMYVAIVALCPRVSKSNSMQQAACYVNQSINICPAVLDLSDGTSGEKITIVCKAAYPLVYELHVFRLDSFETVQTLLQTVSNSNNDEATVLIDDERLQSFGNVRLMTLIFTKPKCTDALFIYRCENQASGASSIRYSHDDAVVSIVAARPTLEVTPDKVIYQQSESVTLLCRARYGQVPGRGVLDLRIELRANEGDAWKDLPGQNCRTASKKPGQGEEDGDCPVMSCTLVTQAGDGGGCIYFRCSIRQRRDQTVGTAGTVLVGSEEKLIITEADACDSVEPDSSLPASVLLTLYIISGVFVVVVVVVTTFFCVRMRRRRAAAAAAQRSSPLYAIQLSQPNALSSVGSSSEVSSVSSYSPGYGRSVTFEDESGAQMSTALSSVEPSSYAGQDYSEYSQSTMY